MLSLRGRHLEDRPMVKDAAKLKFRDGRSEGRVGLSENKVYIPITT